MEKAQLESQVWLYAASFKNCKDRTAKTVDYTKPASAVASEDELKQFSNCI